MSIILRNYDSRKDLDIALEIEEFRTQDLCYRIESALYESRRVLGMPCGEPPEKPLMPRRVYEYDGACIDLIELCRDIHWIWKGTRGYPRYECDWNAAA